MAPNKLLVQAADEGVMIANQGTGNVGVAYGTLARSSTNPEGLVEAPLSRITYSGWYNIGPGQTRYFPANAWFYVEKEGIRYSWADKSETTGVILRPGAFKNMQVDYEGDREPRPSDRDLGQLISQGFELRTFQALPAGVYHVTSTEASTNKPITVATRGNGGDMVTTGAGGTITLEAGFPVDPHLVNVLALGTRAASSLRTDCTGYIGSHPTLRIDWRGTSPELSFYVTSYEDTTLVVKDPSGGYHCNDDWPANASIDPLLLFNNPAEGIYTVWVGKYEIGGTASAQLQISERHAMIPTYLQ
jgi:hypothetical protein